MSFLHELLARILRAVSIPRNDDNCLIDWLNDGPDTRGHSKTIVLKSACTDHAQNPKLWIELLNLPHETAKERFCSFFNIEHLPSPSQTPQVELSMQTHVACIINETDHRTSNCVCLMIDTDRCECTRFIVVSCWFTSKELRPNKLIIPWGHHHFALHVLNC